MFTTLIESAGSRKRQTRWLPASAAVHLMLGAAAVVYSPRANSGIVDAIQTPDIVWVAPQHISQASSQQVRTGTGQVPSSAAEPGRLPPVGEVTPLELPDISSALGGMAAPGDPSMSARADLRLGAGLGGSGSELANGLRSAARVDRVAVPHARNRTPEYPRALRAAGIEGSVIVRFVIDTTGTVEPGSPEVVRTDHPLFSSAVLRALPSYRFMPAEAGGRRVRMLAEQRFEFAIVAP